MYCSIACLKNDDVHAQICGHELAERAMNKMWLLNKMRPLQEDEANFWVPFSHRVELEQRQIGLEVPAGPFSQDLIGDLGSNPVPQPADCFTMTAIAALGIEAPLCSGNIGRAITMVMKAGGVYCHPSATVQKYTNGLSCHARGQWGLRDSERPGVVYFCEDGQWTQRTMARFVKYSEQQLCAWMDSHPLKLGLFGRAPSPKDIQSNVAEILRCRREIDEKALEFTLALSVEDLEIPKASESAPAV